MVRTWWSRYVSMRKSGQSAGMRGKGGSEGETMHSESSCNSRTFRPNRRSHSGPERYAIITISKPCIKNISRIQGKEAYDGLASFRYAEVNCHSRSHFSSLDRP